MTIVIICVERIQTSIELMVNIYEMLISDLILDEPAGKDLYRLALQ